MTRIFAVEAVHDFEHGFERALADLRIAIEDLIDADANAADDVFDVDDKGDTRIDEGELRDLLDRLADAPVLAARAFRNFDWEVARAFRALKAVAGAALCSEVAP